MDDPKPRTQEYHEGEQAARQFEGLVKHAVSVSHEEIERRDKVWKKARKRQHKRVRT